MDWSKAKNILIIALIATNIFLLITYFAESKNDKSIINEDALITVLKGKNIFIDTEIPEKYEKMPAITIEYNNDKNDLIEKTLVMDKYNVPSGSEEEEYHKIADKFLKDVGVNNENLVFDEVLENKKTNIVKYKNCYKEVVIGDSFVEVTFYDGEIKDVTRQFLTATPQSKKKLKVTSPEEALLMFMTEKNIDEEIYVENMQLVFWVNDSTFDGQSLVSDTAFPTWEVTYNGGLIKYIEAYKT